jgi:hypothetical protein
LLFFGVFLRFLPKEAIEHVCIDSFIAIHIPKRSVSLSNSKEEGIRSSHYTMKMIVPLHDRGKRLSVKKQRFCPGVFTLMSGRNRPKTCCLPPYSTLTGDRYGKCGVSRR